MTAKLIEIRDAATTISALAVKLDGSKTDAERWLLGRAGFGTTPDEQAGYVLLLNLTGSSGEWSCDPYEWRSGARTLKVAQHHINEHFDDLASGAIVDVEFLLGETAAQKTTDRLYTASQAVR